MNVKKSNQQIGNEFEGHVLDFFVWLFNKIGFSVTKERKQKAGTQNGFDVFLKIMNHNSFRRIFIECKNYTSNVEIGQVFQKAMELETNYQLNSKNDVFIAISPKTNFSNRNEPDKIQPFWKSKFPFKIELLEKSNHVKNIFALNPTLYKKIYNEDLSFKIDINKEIERFKSIIFSIDILTTFLNENDKLQFIGKIKPNENFIKRTLVNNNSKEFHLYYRGKIIEDVLDKENYIAILGNPGTGKTCLLQQIACMYWKEGEQNSYTPIYRNLRNFSSRETLKNYLPQKLKNTPYPLFILDGIDEIQNIEHFKSELHLFTQKQSLNSKYIISCRNNIYNSIVRNASNFNTYYLKDFSYDESFNLLEKLCPNVNIRDFSFNNKHLDFIKSPQQTEILAEYINKNNQLTNNFSELWRTYIEQRLKDNVDKLEKRPYDSFLFTNEAPKIGIVGELMQTTSLSKKHLKKLLNNSYSYVNQFTLSPLISSDEYHFSFENRNIQEYFAAIFFSELEKEKILLQFIIKDCNKIHPNLINTLSFLLQIVDDSTHNFIVDWLLKNENELFFKFDNNRISKRIKIKIFQDYFKQQCIDKSLWISEDYTIEEIGKFGDCAENQEYLIYIISNKNYHFRVIQSALYLLGHLSIYDNKQKLISLFKKMIRSNNVTLNTKEEILNTIYLLKLTKENNSFLSFLIESFIDFDDEKIRYRLMNLLKLESHIDNYFRFFFEEFKKENNLEERKTPSKVKMGGYSWIIDKLLLKIDNDNLFLEVFKLFFTKEHHIFNKITDDLLQKAVEKVKKNNQFIIDLYESIEKDYLCYSSSQKSTILKICKLSNTKNYLCEHIANKFPRKDYINISLFVSEFNIDSIVTKIIHKKDIINDEFERLRNDIRCFNSTELAVLFDEKLQKLGIQFNQPVFTIEAQNQQKMNLLNFKQENFNLLFEKDKLLNSIELIFKDNYSDIDYDILYTIENSWADDMGHEYYNLNSSINIIEEILHEYSNENKINFTHLRKELLKHPIILIEQIKEQLEHNPEIKVNTHQIKQIANWSTKVTNELNFKNVWALNNNRKGFSYLNNSYKKIELIYYFKNKLNIDIDQSFILKLLPYLLVSNNDDKIFIQIKKWCGDLVKFENHIIQLIQNKSLPIFIENKYIDYAIENCLTTVETEIKAYFLTSNYYSSSNFSLFIKNFQLQDSLKDYCNDINTDYCWNALKILFQTDSSSNQFCTQKAVEYLQTPHTIFKYKRDALEILFTSNHPYIINFILNKTKEKHFEDLESYDLIGSDEYNYYKDDQIITHLFDFIYLNDWKDSRQVYNLKIFFEKYIENLVINHYDKIKNIFKVKLKRASEKDTLFHVNRFIKIIENKHISNLSKPMEFNEAFNFVSSL